MNNGFNFPRRYTLSITCINRRGHRKRYTFKTRVVALDSGDAEEFGSSFAESRLSSMGESPEDFSIKINVSKSNSGRPAGNIRPGGGFDPKKKRSIVKRLIRFFQDN